jgi:preprotein translocase subunit SecD
MPRVVWIVTGAFGLLIVAAVVITLVTSLQPNEHKVKGTVQLRQVLVMTNAACPAGAADRVTSVKSDACYQLGEGMQISKVKDARLDASNGTPWSVAIDLRPEDTGRLSTLTRRVAAEQEPRNLLAIVVDGKVVSAPQVISPITGGKLILTGQFTRAEAERYVKIFGG